MATTFTTKAQQARSFCEQGLWPEEMAFPRKREVKVPRKALTFFYGGVALALAWFAGIHQAAAQSARFFRISGPAATAITALRPDGALVWSNALKGTNYTIQTLSTLSGRTGWVSYAQVPATSNVSTNQLVAFNPPAGMVFIPAGVFTMGNFIINGTTIANDADITDANPTNVTVSAFYMDATLVTSNQWRSVYAYATNHGYGFIHPVWARRRIIPWRRWIGMTV